MDTLKQQVHDLVADYARNGLNSRSYVTHTDDNSILSVVTIVQGKNTTFVSLLVRITDETIIIERDQNDKPLLDALLQAGIPRSQIILAYAGEPVPAVA